MILIDVPISWPLFPLLPVIKGFFPAHEEGVLHADHVKDGVLVFLVNLYDVSKESLANAKVIRYASVEDMLRDGWTVD